MVAGAAAAVSASAGLAASSAAGSAALASVSPSVAGRAGTAGVSSAFSSAFSVFSALPLPYGCVSLACFPKFMHLCSCYQLTLMVARSLEKAEGDLGFSASSSDEASFFLPKAKGSELLRFSLLTSFLVSPLTAAGTSTVSVGTVAGEETSAERGSLVSTAGITGAVSATASVVVGVSLEGEASVGVTAFFLPKERLPKML